MKSTCDNNVQIVFAESAEPNGESCRSESTELQENLHNQHSEYHGFLAIHIIVVCNCRMLQCFNFLT